MKKIIMLKMTANRPFHLISFFCERLLPDHRITATTYQTNGIFLMMVDGQQRQRFWTPLLHTPLTFASDMLLCTNPGLKLVPEQPNQN
jgi:hypothetical protein